MMCGVSDDTRRMEQEPLQKINLSQVSSRDTTAFIIVITQSVQTKDAVILPRNIK